LRLAKSIVLVVVLVLDFQRVLRPDLRNYPRALIEGTSNALGETIFEDEDDDEDENEMRWEEWCCWVVPDV
jgi:hypothetical protein